jgi:predicted alternative tryptophan synthase beta-subunit
MHAMRVAIDEATKAKKQSKEQVIVMNISGQGHMDMEG